MHEVMQDQDEAEVEELLQFHRDRTNAEPVAVDDQNPDNDDLDFLKITDVPDEGPGQADMQELDKVHQPENVDDGDANAEAEEVHQAPRRSALDNVISLWTLASNPDPD